MNLSIELVPRSLEALETDLADLNTHFPQLDTVNIPDLLRFKMRSWHACHKAKTHMRRAIPHLRAIDVNPDKPLTVAPFLQKHGLDEILIVAGDAPSDMSRTVYDSTTPEVIRRFKAEMPGIKVYAALDPYRQNFVRELAYAEEKLAAGAVGLFSQPFFDLRLMAVYRELLAGVPVYWGVTPVTSKRSLGYWRNRNKAVFPGDFEPTLEWCQNLARDALEFAHQHDTNLYFMPIRTSPVEFLRGVL